MGVLQDLIIMLFSAAMVLMLTARFKIPSILGFLITGILIGPHVLKVIPDAERIREISEIGVMLLMFNVGLEFSLDKLKSMKFEVLVLGSLQVCLTIFASTIGIHKLGLPLSAALMASFVISLGSTAMVVKILKDNMRLQTPSGRIMLGILLFQDICVVPMIILTPGLHSLGSGNVLMLLNELLKSFALISIILALAKYLLPKIFDRAVGVRINELFLILILVFCFGLAMITNKLGFSFALGSFIAGMVLAESGYISQIEADIRQLRNVFLSIFFIAVGMLLDIAFLESQFFLLLGGTLAIIFLKVLIVVLILILFKNPLNVSIQVAFGLAQIGEFSFLLLNIAKPTAVLSDFYYQYFLSVTIISMLLTPLMLYLGNYIADRNYFKKNISSKTDHGPDAKVIIAGFGINGQNLSKVFKALNISYKIIEVNPFTVKKYKEKGENIYFGDITQPDNLRFLGVENASMMVIAISDAEATRKVVELGRRMNPQLHIIVRSEYITQIENLYKNGANVVISQDFEASIEVASHVLKFLGIANRIVRMQTNALRRQHYRFFTNESIVSHKINIAKLAAIEKFHEIFFVLYDSKIAGETIKKIVSSFADQSKDVEVIGLIRDNQIYHTFQDGFLIQALDTLILYGEQARLHHAIAYLESYASKKSLPHD